MEQIKIFNQAGIKRHFTDINDKIRKQLRSNLSSIKDGDPTVIARDIANRYKVNCPVFDFPNTENTIQKLPYNNGFEVFLSDFAFYKIPFSGDKEILKCKPDRTNCMQPFPLQVDLYVDRIEFDLNSYGNMDNPGQPRDRVKMYANSIKDYIECSIDSLKKSIEIFNESLEETLLNSLTDAKTKLMAKEASIKEKEDDLNPFKNLVNK